MATSGTYTFNPSAADVVFEAYDRVGIRPSEITPDHMISARRSLNLVQSRWANRGVNLWAVDLVTVPLSQGVTQYAVDGSTVNMLDVYLRIYQMNAPVDLTPAFATTSSSATVTVMQTAHGLSVSDYMQVIVPVSIGGIILYGFYQVVSVIDSDNYTITAASAATSTASGGAVPSFATTINSSTVTATLANHGYLAGQSFTVQVATTVGGVTLSGAYTIVSVPTSDTFTFSAGYAAGSTATASENSGDAQIAGQAVTADPIDRLLRPISRTEYASYADKFVQAPPTVFWYDRLISPNVTLWQVPDQNGPYELRYYRVRQIQDAVPTGGQTVEIPYRFMEAMCAELAAHLAMKWKPDSVDMLTAYAKDAWAEAAVEDTERVSTYIQPMLQSYYN